MKKIQAGLFFLVLSTLLFPQWSQTNGIRGGYFQSVASSGNHLFASTGNGGVFISDGTNWAPTQQAITANTLLVDGNAVIGINYGYVFVTTDNGISWVKRVIPETLNTDPILSAGKMYVIGASGDSVFSSSDLGNSWTAFNVNKNFTLNNENRQIFFAMNLFVSGGKIWIDAFTDNSPQSIILLESTDQGQSWNVAFTPQNNEKVTAVALENGTELLTTDAGVYTKNISGEWVASSDGLQLGSGAVIPFNALKYISGNFYLSVVGDNSGLFKFDGTTWNNLNAPAFVNDYTFYQGQLTVSTSGKIMRKSGNEWISITDGLIASTAAPIVMSENVVFSLYGTSLYRTTDGGNNWDSIAPYIGTPVFQNNLVYGYNSLGVIRSGDFGNTWSTLNGGIPQTHVSKIHAVAASGNTLYAGFHGTRSRDHLPPVWEQGGVYRSTDNGATWSVFSSGLVQEAGVPAPIVEMKASASRVVVRTIEGIYTLNGSNWQRISNNFPAGTYFTSMKVVGDSIVFGGNRGLAISTDNGIQWQYYKDGLPDSQLDLFYIKYFNYLGHFFAYYYQGSTMYRLKDTSWVQSEFTVPQNLDVMALEAAGDVLYAGTIDRGIWKYLKTPTSVEEKESSPVAFTLDQNYPNPFNPSTTISFNLERDGFVSVKIFNILGELVTEPLKQELGKGSHKINFDASNLQSGIYIYTVSQNGKSLSRKMTLLK